VLANWVPEVQVLDLPFISSEEHAIKANALLKSKLERNSRRRAFICSAFRSMVRVS